MQDLSMIEALLLMVRLPLRLFPRYKWRVMAKGDGFLLQLIFVFQDSQSGELEEQRCRKWYVSPHSTDTEVLRTAYKACEAALLHELDEFFLVDGQQIHSPHIDVFEQVRLAKEAERDKRE
jgi:hypothetical protein